MNLIKNILSHREGRQAIAEAVPKQWYDPNAVNGKFVDELVQELESSGFQLRSTGDFSETVDGVTMGGVRGTYSRGTGWFSWDSVTLCVGSNQTAATGGIALFYGITAKAGSKGPQRKWAHAGVTTDLYGPGGQVPSGQYNPGLTAAEALANVGLEAVVTSEKTSGLLPAITQSKGGGG